MAKRAAPSKTSPRPKAIAAPQAEESPYRSESTLSLLSMASGSGGQTSASTLSSMPR